MDDYASLAKSALDAISSGLDLIKMVIGPRIKLKDMKADLLVQAAMVETFRLKTLGSFLRRFDAEGLDIESADISDDWFIKLCITASNNPDEHIQDLLEAILRGEVTNPGSFSKRTLDVLGNMSQKEADLFVKCMGRTICADGNLYVMITSKQGDQNEMSRSELRMLGDCGLIRFDAVGYALDENMTHRLEYGDTCYDLEYHGTQKILLPSVASFTTAGLELSRLVLSMGIVDFDYDLMGSVIKSLAEENAATVTPYKGIEIRPYSIDPDRPITTGIHFEP